jgi:hypothetical protein
MRGSMTNPSEKTAPLPGDGTFESSQVRHVRRRGALIGRVFDRTRETLVVLGLVISLLATMVLAGVNPLTRERFQSVGERIVALG